MLTTKLVFTLALMIRVILFLIGLYVDNYTSSSYTDLDYKVFTDGAKYILQGQSPFLRHTYRYTPLLAIIMTPNIFLNENFGKILFILLDIICGVLITKIINKENKNTKNVMLLIWFFNPITINLSTRGSSDVIISFLILLTFYFILNKNLNLAAIIYGFTVHFKIYPIIYSIALYLYIKEDRPFFNQKSIKFGIISAVVFLFTTFIFYPFYGWEYFYEAFLYHLIRKDHRHNFSVQFLYIYSSFFDIDKITSIMLFLPSIVLIVVITAKFYRKIIFCCFLLTYVFVIFNKVVTAQYFVWYIQFLPIFFYDTIFFREIKKMKEMGYLTVAWLVTVIAWNNMAFRFEARSQDVFWFFHFLNILFFMINILIAKKFVTDSDFIYKEVKNT
jgi:phosphatidylinositol glycan class M